MKRIMIDLPRCKNMLTKIFTRSLQGHHDHPRFWQNYQASSQAWKVFFPSESSSLARISKVFPDLGKLTVIRYNRFGLTPSCGTSYVFSFRLESCQNPFIWWALVITRPGRIKLEIKYSHLKALITQIYNQVSLSTSLLCKAKLKISEY